MKNFLKNDKIDIKNLMNIGIIMLLFLLVPNVLKTKQKIRAEEYKRFGIFSISEKYKDIKTIEDFISGQDSEKFHSCKKQSDYYDFINNLTKNEQNNNLKEYYQTREFINFSNILLYQSNDQINQMYSKIQMIKNLDKTQLTSEIDKANDKNRYQKSVIEKNNRKVGEVIC